MGVSWTHIRTLAIHDSSSNKDLAISPNGAVMAISNGFTHKISTYSLPDGARMSDFGGKGSRPGKFNSPQKLCFSPRSGNLLIADSLNNRVQVCPVAASHS